MPKSHALNTENLAKVDDGKIAAALDSCIRQALLDCADRPNEDKARKVTLEITFAPIVNDTGAAMDDVQTSFSMKVSTPKLQTRDYVMQTRERSGQRGETIVTASFSDRPAMEEPEFIKRDGSIVRDTE